MKSKNTMFLVQAATIGAIYVVLTLLFAPLSYGEVQVRFSEALTILPYFTPAAIPGLFVGCILSNLLGGAIPVDHRCYPGLRRDSPELFFRPSALCFC